MKQTWDVRIESFDGWSFDMTSGKARGKISEAAGARVRYRRAGSRGRFESFVVVDQSPDWVTKRASGLISKYERAKKKRAA